MRTQPPPTPDSPAPIRAVTFDLWHTLVYLPPEEEERYMAEQLELAADTLLAAPASTGQPSLDRAGARAVFQRELLAAVTASRDGRSVTPAEQIALAAARVGRTVDAASYLRGLRAVVGRTRFVAAPGVLEMLRTVREAGFRTALISNTTGEPGEALRPMLVRLGIERALDALVFSDERPWTKPASEIFDDALRALDAVADRSVHVGDGWSDIEGARRAGFRAGILFTGLQKYGEQYRRLFLPAGWNEPPTPYRTDSLAEVPGIVERLLPPAAGTGLP